MVKQAANHKNKIIGILIIVLVVTGIYFYFRYDTLYPSTDDAYINAKLVNVAPKVTGYLQTLEVKNNQEVHKGDLLFTINPVDYKLSVEQAQKSYDSQVSQVEAIKKQLGVQLDQTAQNKSKYQLVQSVAERYKKLLEQNTISKQAYENAEANLTQARKQLDIDKRRLDQLYNIYDSNVAKMEQSKVGVDSAKSNLSFTKYISPVDGYITNLTTLNPGEFISAGSQMFGIVANDEWWVDANFKETQLSRIKPGQTVDVDVDMYNGHKYKGVVQSISYSSGNAFSLLPAQNATGNWVKVTQRFTVRIKIENDAAYPLRVGASCAVRVKTV